jgi:acetylornithine deacetylase/succinyl-diaminopimelate desuccinylase-like protein
MLKELLAIPNYAKDIPNINKNIDWCDDKLQSFGFETERLPTETIPLLLGSILVDASLPTAMFYFHIDGQPVDPQFWYQDSPYNPALKEQREGEGWVEMDWENLSNPVLNPEWRIFARSSSDDKSPFVMFIAALQQLVDEKLKLPYNLKIILDFEEEIGSPRLAGAVNDFKEKLNSDFLIIFDGPRHISNEPTITYGARGITTISLKVFGPTFPLHSGHYGNYAPNPALRLSQLLASMKDENGRVTIEGYYDHINLTDNVKEILSKVPDDENEFKVKLGIGSTDKVGNNYQEALQYPSLNIRGLSSGWTGDESRTIVPATALAEIDIRLVLESDPQRIVDLVKKHIQKQGYLILDRKPDSRERVLNAKICQFTNNRAYKAFRTDLDSPLGKWVYHSVKNTFQKEPIRLRTFGGSVPISPFISALKIPAVIVPLVNSDNNQHSPNENLKLVNFFDGVKTFHGLLRSPYQQ